MTAALTRPARKAILTDLGGVLIPDYLQAAAAAWSARLGITPPAVNRNFLQDGRSPGC